MTNERLIIELNETNCKREGNTLTITIPADKQSAEGIDFYFNKDQFPGPMMMKSVNIKPHVLDRFWNWMFSRTGSSEYRVDLEKPVDISKITESWLHCGDFGFSGYTKDDSDVVIEITLDE